MLNRRSLRIKAFKNLFALENGRQANKQLAFDLVVERFSPDLNSMEVVDENLLKENRKLASDKLEETLKLEKGEKTILSKDDPVDVVVEEALELFNNENTKDYNRFKKDLFSEADKVNDGHLRILSLLIEFAFQNKKIYDEKLAHADLMGPKSRYAANFYSSKVIEKFRNDPTLNQALQSRKINWGKDGDLLRDWYKGIIFKDETFHDYLKKESAGYQDDYEILDYLCRNIILKNEALESYFEDFDLNWMENKPIVRSLVLKTLKSVKEEESDLKLAEISYNLEEDVEFVKELFARCVHDSDYLEGLIMEKLQNWDIDRIALTDRVILKEALAEMIFFPSIPVKVTINEYIEISKLYSTPKSKKFINGLLDVLSLSLIERGIIKKSGRGLLDNK